MRRSRWERKRTNRGFRRKTWGQETVEGARASGHLVSLSPAFPEGQTAYEKFADPEAFDVEASRLYNEWKGQDSAARRFSVARGTTSISTGDVSGYNGRGATGIGYRWTPTCAGLFGTATKRSGRILRTTCSRYRSSSGRLSSSACGGGRIRRRRQASRRSGEWCSGSVGELASGTSPLTSCDTASRIAFSVRAAATS
jgi:hypothetical protein